jgi:hypothetical protein
MCRETRCSRWALGPGLPRSHCVYQSVRAQPLRPAACPGRLTRCWAPYPPTPPQMYVAEDLAGLSRLARQHSAAAGGSVVAELEAVEALPLPLLHPAPAGLRQRAAQQQVAAARAGEPTVLQRQALALQHLGLQVGGAGPAAAPPLPPASTASRPGWWW